MKKLKKRYWFLIVLLLIFVGLYGTWQYLLTRSYPDHAGSVFLTGVQNKVEICRDEQGIPTILAGNMEDMFFGQGYVHAQDRFWQMDELRRYGNGTLSELMGKFALYYDKYTRTMGFGRTVKQEYEKLDEKSKQYLQAYANGINSYIINKDPSQLGLQYEILKFQGINVKIDPWLPHESLLWVKVFADELSRNMALELTMGNLLQVVGTDKAEPIMFPYAFGNFPYIVPNQGKAIHEQKNRYTDRNVAFHNRKKETLNQPVLPSSLFFGKDPAVGTNSWAISGKLTNTGKPLLANDPHLVVKIPSDWYKNGLQVNEIDGSSTFKASGFSFPGVPGIIIGHNQNVAWGYSALPADVQDYFVEKINPDNKNQYRKNDQWVDMEIFEEEIFIAGESKPFLLKVRKTEHGPILSDIPELVDSSDFFGTDSKQAQEYALSLSWPALEVTNTLKSILLMNQAKNSKEFRKALRDFDAPAHNIIYADTENNIGYQAVGKIPIRSKGNGLTPRPGWDNDFAWQGYIPFDDLPSLFNPDQGYIVAANNAITSSNQYPYFISHEFMGFRARRIEELIASKGGNISLSDMETLQFDHYNSQAKKLVDYLKDINFQDESVQSAKKILQDWDGNMDKNSYAALLYGYFWMELVNTMYQDELASEREAFEKTRLSSSTIKHILDRLLEDPDNIWWDNRETKSTKETLKDIVKLTFIKASHTCFEKHGQEAENSSWGDIHQVHFKDVLFGITGISLVDGIFNRGPFGMDGGVETVNNATWRFSEPFEVFIFSSFRQIIDLDNFSRSKAIYGPGQSGHPGHKNYADLIQPWLAGEYLYDKWKVEEVRDGAANILTLKNNNQ